MALVSRVLYIFIAILSCIPSRLSINCGVLTITCNDGSPGCYRGACADMAPYFSNINTLTAITVPPVAPSVAPTARLTSGTPTLSPTLRPTTAAPTTTTTTTTAHPTENAESGEESTHNSFGPSVRDIECGAQYITGWFKSMPVYFAIEIPFGGDIVFNVTSFGFSLARISAYYQAFPDTPLLSQYWSTSLVLTNVAAHTDIVFELVGVGKGIYIVDNQCVQKTPATNVNHNNGIPSLQPQPQPQPYIPSTSPPTSWLDSWNSNFGFSATTTTTEYEEPEYYEYEMPELPDHDTSTTTTTTTEYEGNEIDTGGQQGAGSSSSDDADAKSMLEQDDLGELEVLQLHATEQPTPRLMLTPWALFLFCLFVVIPVGCCVYYRVCKRCRESRSRSMSNRASISFPFQSGQRMNMHRSEFDTQDELGDDEWTECEESDCLPPKRNV